MNYWRILIGLLRLSNAIVQWIGRNRLIDHGRKLQLAEELGKIAESGRAAREMRQRVETMSDKDLDDVLAQ